MDTQAIIAIAAPPLLPQLKGPNKLAWGVITVSGELLGPLVYFLFGRREQEA